MMSPDPLISILTPIPLEGPQNGLMKSVASVLAQSDADWEFLVGDSGGLQEDVEKRISHQVRRYRRGADTDDVRLLRYSEGLDASELLRALVRVARGSYVCIVWPGDTLRPAAMRQVSAALNDDPDVDFLYTDELTWDPWAGQMTPFLKPDWSPERLRAHHYTGNLAVFRRTILEEVLPGIGRSPQARRYEMALRATQRADRVRHIPVVLYESCESSRDSDFASSEEVLQEHCDRTGVPGTVEPTLSTPGFHSIKPTLEQEPSVSIIIPTGGGRRLVHGIESCLVELCVESIVSRTSYPNYEIVVVADDSVTTETERRLSELAGARLTLVPYRKPFNYSDKINTGAHASSGEVLVFLNDDIEIVEEDWLASLVMNLQVPGVGAVGTRLLLPDGRVQHAGVGLFAGGPGHVFYGVSGTYAAYRGSPHISANYAAVTGACTAVSRTVFEAVGGLTETLPINYNDVDFCLKVSETGLRIVYEPRAQMIHHESSSRSAGHQQWELDTFLRRWGQRMGNDPYLNPNLSGGNLLRSS